ncbi:MAG: bifunctional aspartate kinase/homoserine dehydrogenase I [Cloacibacterium sp.]|nr:bifunctional aspartate kinase/homoserine dehydrogenase I [Cloacibacterium sp.]
MKILKFGGSSVANAENIQKTIQIIKNQSLENPTIVVVSALSGVTDSLIEAANLAASLNEEFRDVVKELEDRHLTLVKELIPVYEQSQWLSFVKRLFNEIEDICQGIFILGELTPKIKDRLTSFGEILSSNIIVAKLLSDEESVVWADSRLLIKTDQSYTQAKVDFDLTNANLQEYWEENSARIVMFPGFIASDELGNTTTLGRGGSDYTAAILASALNAKELQIWTDVSGMMTADPRLVRNAKPVKQISYKEAMELSHFGAKVIYPPTIHPVLNKNIEVWIKNTFAPNDYGTLITQNERSSTENETVAVGISNMSNISLLTLEGSGMVGIPGFSAKLFQCLSDEKINVILITQSSSEHSITVAINDSEVERAELALNQKFNYDLKLNKLDPIKVEKSLAIIALVGDNMKNRSGVSGRMFSALGKNAVNIRAIAQGSSEKNISVVISNEDVRKAVNTLHEEFFESEIKQIHLYLCGVGNVGSKLIQQIHAQNQYLRENLSINLRISGLSNSKKMVFKDHEGFGNVDVLELLSQGEESSPQEYANEIIKRNLRNSILVDVTANAEVVEIYEKVLNKSISVVACNKIAAASDYATYRKLKSISKEKGCKFFFETNVGAGLPIIGTINDLIRSGDQITSIQAVLSGTLNFVFNNYDETRPFAEVVRQAQEEGYTEPDPRLDLAGTDVARKILILAREAGIPLEFNEIENERFLPDACMQGSVEDFYVSLAEHEHHFKNLYEEAKSKGCILKYVADFKGGKAKVGLQHIAPDSDLYHLYGKDNIVILKTLRYSEQPLVVKGAGAGADVTASGVFADIVRSAGI